LNRFFVEEIFLEARADDRLTVPLGKWEKSPHPQAKTCIITWRLRSEIPLGLDHQEAQADFL
jgi:hypothetical protein